MMSQPPIKTIIDAILSRSTEAVLSYRDASGLPDNELQEEFISSHMVAPLFRDLDLLCRREWLYVRIVSAMGVKTLTEQIGELIGGFCADLALFDTQARPLVAVELKVDDGGPSRPRFAIVSDIVKLQKLKSLCPVTALALVMLTDLKDREVEERRVELEKMTPSVAWTWGPTQRARDGKWDWAMGCAQCTGG